MEENVTITVTIRQASLMYQAMLKEVLKVQDIPENRHLIKSEDHLNRVAALNKILEVLPRCRGV